MGVLTDSGDDGIYTDCTLQAADGIDSAMNLVKRFSERVRDLIKRDKLDCFLVPDPLEGHAGYICA